MRDTYAHKALQSIPRLLGNQDRNLFSPTYGSFHRDYWLDKTSDFPDAVRQFSVHALALVYKHDMPNNPYLNNKHILDWAVAGLAFWSDIQHKDGSFDEFYPYERGWVGPSAFTTYTSIEAYQLLQDEIAPPQRQKILDAIHRAARFIGKGEAEEDHLANHHAMACLALWKAYQLLDDPALLRSFEQAWQTFLTYHNADEGWSREYDGVDPGYLSATISFLGKIYQTNPDAQILDVLRQSVEFSAYFVYPNGFYAGSTGSRNTLHFYPHGYEILADDIPLAKSIAERMLQALADDKLVPPEIISDRYVVYRVPEFLLAYLDYTPPSGTLLPLPYEQPPFTRYFEQARIFVHNAETRYTIANLAKGGVVKHFDTTTGELLYNDTGIIGETTNETIVSSQWIDKTYQVKRMEDGWQVSGLMNQVPPHRVFTPFKHILFRSTLLALGWNSEAAHWLKGQIRKTLILNQKPVPIHFTRRLRFLPADEPHLTDTIACYGDTQLKRLQIGGEFFVRYVPQSRYFQSQELGIDVFTMSPQHLQHLNNGGKLTVSRTTAKQPKFEVTTIAPDQLPEGVYNVEYFAGRLTKPQLIYRLKRRTDEVAEAINHYLDQQPQIILDVGTADGLMLERLQACYPGAVCLGLDYSYDLLNTTPPGRINKGQADALAIPVRGGVVDAIVATAIIEHVANPTRMMQECFRVLREGGLLIITTPQPTIEKIASAIGLLKEAGHQTTFDLPELVELGHQVRFNIMEAKRFMFSPIGFPQEKAIETVMRSLKVDFVMANQLVVLKK